MVKGVCNMVINLREVYGGAKRKHGGSKRPGREFFCEDHTGAVKTTEGEVITGAIEGGKN